MASPVLAAVVPAAGRSARFGSQKLLADVDGVPLVQRTLTSLLDAGVARVVVVARDPKVFDGVPAFVDARVTIALNPDPERGMFSSIQAGLGIADGDVVLVLPADMPFVAASTIALVAARAAVADGVVVPVHDGRRGHPIAIPRAWCDRLVGIAATTTLKDALAASGASTLPVDVPDPGVLRDVDVPGDLADYAQE